ncbi:hypothetical protein [Corallococcus llansteffanensis]|uniref:Uncharacterized protein n=1 Tax=Corallococcus llansteffanensis TaxID=2316731 RepID=A0A3A8Q4V9_9BACT|nr:hypothetical protein [Corallococcus llansteffanensis]RKH59952.1 hypothetical protein D7V93_14040 [Corallococcus llansteffanensis]
MRIRVLFPLCITGLVLACATQSRTSNADPAALSDGTLVESCTTPPTPPTDAGVVVDITADAEGKVHFSSKTVRVDPGQTVTFVSNVNQDRCIGVSDYAIFAGDVTGPLLVSACTSASWTLLASDASKQYQLWACATTGDCSKCTQPQGVKETINGTLEVTGRGGD